MHKQAPHRSSFYLRRPSPRSVLRSGSRSPQSAPYENAPLVNSEDIVAAAHEILFYIVIFVFINSSLPGARTGIGMSQREHVGIRLRFLAKHRDISSDTVFERHFNYSQSAAVFSFINSRLSGARTGIGMSQREHVGVRLRFLADQLQERQGRKQAFNACLQPELRGKNIRFFPRHRGLPCRTELSRLEPGGSPDSAPVETSVPEQPGRRRPVNQKAAYPLRICGLYFLFFGFSPD